MARVSRALDMRQVVSVGNALKTFKTDVDALAAGYGALAAVMLKKAVTEFVPASRDFVVRVATVDDDVEVVINAETYVRLVADMRRYLLVSETYTLLWTRRYGAMAGSFLDDLTMHASHHAEAANLAIAPTPLSRGFNARVVRHFVEECVQEAEWPISKAATRLQDALFDLADVLNVPAGLPEETAEQPPADWLVSREFQSALVTTLRGMTDAQVLAARPVLVMVARFASEASQQELAEDPDRRFFWASVFSEALGAGEVTEDGASSRTG